ncbi:MAG: glycosyltransferase family 8 protein [Myxococcales bacterium]
MTASASTSPGPVVVLCADDGYAMAAGVCVRSIARNYAGEEPLQLLFLADSIRPANRERILECASGAAKVSIRWVEADPSASGKRSKTDFAHPTYWRLRIPELLSTEHRKAIYLDTDTVVTANLGELWQQDLGPYALLAAQDYDHVVSSPGHFPIHRRLGIPATNRYFNAGALVLNLDFWRAQDVARRCFEFLERFGESCAFYEQDALNGVLFRHWAPLERRWNWQDPHTEAAFPGVVRRWRRQLLRVPPPEIPAERVVHFCGIRKPWQAGYLGQGRALFYEYLDQTPWRGWRVSQAQDLAALYRRDLPRAARRLADHGRAAMAKLDRPVRAALGLTVPP